MEANNLYNKSKENHNKIYYELITEIDFKILLASEKGKFELCLKDDKFDEYYWELKIHYASKGFKVKRENGWYDGITISWRKSIVERMLEKILNFYKKGK